MPITARFHDDEAKLHSCPYESPTLEVNKEISSNQYDLRESARKSNIVHIRKAERPVLSYITFEWKASIMTKRVKQAYR